MSKKSYRSAIKEAIEFEMRRDPTVVVIGEDVRGGHGAKNTEKTGWKGLVAYWGSPRDYGPNSGLNVLLIRQ